jgi:hypothetical protein
LYVCSNNVKINKNEWQHATKPLLLEEKKRNAIPVEIASLEVAGDHVVAGGQTEGGTGSAVHNHHPSEHQSRRKRGIFLYDIQHCFIYRPSDFSVSEDAGIEPRTVATCGIGCQTL